jgi:hypothetical protein
VTDLAGDKSDRARDKEINRKFEQQGRRLNRGWLRNAASGFFVFVLIMVALQFTPYKDVPKDILKAAKNFIQKLTTGKAAPAEPDAKYW